MPKNDELQALFNLLAQRLGTQPEQLKSSAQSGDLSKIIGNMNPNDASKIQKILNDKAVTEKLLSSPQAQELLKRFSGQ